MKSLRSPYDQVGGLFYFGRMIDKIRLHAAGDLPADYQPHLGKGFDDRCLTFLGINYAALCEKVLSDPNASDDDLLEWCHETGTNPCTNLVDVWNEFMRKFGWNDQATPRLKLRLAESGLQNRPDIQTFFDLVDVDEGRPPHPLA